MRLIRPLNVARLLTLLLALGFVLPSAAAIDISAPLRVLQPENLLEVMCVQSCGLE